jgi:ABC-2 type transport system ATP-binding protein
MIQCEHLSKNFEGKVAVRGLSMIISPGEIFGFLGPNGAGKTTTVKMLTGMLLPSSGTAKVAGFDVVSDPIEVKKRIGYVPESAALFESLTAWEFLELISELHHLERKPAHRRIQEFLSVFGILGDKDQRLATFSKGMKQKVLIASSLLHNPPVLFFDEPLNGLDANAALIVKELLKKMAAQGKTILFCSHILEVVERICTRIGIIHNGELITQGAPDEIALQTREPNLEKAFGKLTGVRDTGEYTDSFLQALASN